jgi:hypothetical protein
MQYPVPQFTDVEDKIIGPLTIKQFGIVFSAGIIIVLVYTASKNLLITGLFGFLIGLPALGIAFVKFNGRPMYSSIGVLVKFILDPKVLIFHKEASSFGSSVKLKNVEITLQKEEVVKPKEDTKARLKEINKLLQEQAQQERELVKNIHST